MALKIKNSFLVEWDHAKVSLWGVDSLLGDCMFIQADCGSKYVVDLSYFALFEDFSL